MLHSQHNHAAVHHFNVADKLQHVNSTCVKGAPSAVRRQKKNSEDIYWKEVMEIKERCCFNSDSFPV